MCYIRSRLKTNKEEKRSVTSFCNSKTPQILLWNNIFQIIIDAIMKFIIWSLYILQSIFLHHSVIFITRTTTYSCGIFVSYSVFATFDAQNHFIMASMISNVVLAIILIFKINVNTRLVSNIKFVENFEWNFNQ